MDVHLLNPFLYGKPVPPSRFIGRREVLRTIFSRLHHGDSTALLGLPHFGKSSILRYLDNPAVRKAWLGPAANQLQVVQFDCHALQPMAQARDFWRLVVDATAQARQDDPGVQRAAAAAHQGGYNPMLMTQLFGQALGEKGHRVALLLDEVEVLLHHPNFCRSEFLGLLRSLATRTDGLVILLASSLSLTQMNRLSAEINRGSPFFNNCIEIALPPLSQAEIELLLTKSLEGQAYPFSQQDCGFVTTQSGGQPYLVQAAAAALFDVMAAGDTPSSEHHRRAIALLHQRVPSYFDALWLHLDGRLRQSLLIHAIARVPGRGIIEVQAASEYYATERQQLRQLGLLLPAAAPSGQSCLSCEDSLAESLAAWILVQAAAHAHHPDSDQWEHFIKGSLDGRRQSEQLRTRVKRLSEDASWAAVFAALPATFAVANSAPARSVAQRPTRESLRLVLRRLLHTDAELDRFCIDHFKENVFDRFTGGMDRTARVNLLLSCVEPEILLARLHEALPQEFAECQHLIRWQ